MTRKGPSKAADAGFSSGRLAMARAFMKAAQNEAELTGDNEVGNPIVSLIVHAAIAYVDALTAKVAGRVNQQDHSGATESLRAALGNRLPNDHERRLGRILAEKDAAEYGARIKRRSEAAKLLIDLEKFAEWAERELTRGP